MATMGRARRWADFMERFLYEHSTTDRGYLIIPAVVERVLGQPIYSYGLLSALGRRGQFHRQINPAQLHSGCLEGIRAIALDHLHTHLTEHPEAVEGDDYFQSRYTYRHYLIVIVGMGGKVFYDCYPPACLDNVAAPKLFISPADCIAWVRKGLDQALPEHSDALNPLG